jgi:hypothetical protein
MITRAALEKQRTSLIDYLGSKLEAEDWHACADAAMDLREVDAQLALMPIETPSKPLTKTWDTTVCTCAMGAGGQRIYAADCPVHNVVMPRG